MSKDELLCTLDYFCVRWKIFPKALGFLAGGTAPGGARVVRGIKKGARRGKARKQEAAKGGERKLGEGIRVMTQGVQDGLI